MATPSGSNGAPKGEDGQPSSSRFSSSSSSRLEVTDLTLQLLETITNNFSDEHKVGTGGYGKVYRGKYNGHEIAVKKLYIMHGLDDEDFKNEFRQLMKVQHENIIRLIAYCHEIKHKYVEDNGELIFAKVIDRALCFEYMQEGSLDRHISDHSCIHDWATTYKIIRGTCEGLHYLHKGRGEGNYIYHMDLKPDNILLDKDMNPKITDFGLSRLFGKSKTHQTCSLKGTIGFMPPEYINNGTMSPKNDVFSLGVIIFYLLAGQIGYVDYCDARCSHQEFIERVQEYWKEKMHAEPYYIWEEIDLLGVKICIELAMSCVVKEREKRPSIEMIIYELQKLDTQTDNMSKRDSGQSLPTPTKRGPKGGRRGTARDIIQEKPWRLTSLTIIYREVIDAFSFSYIDQSRMNQHVGPWGGTDNSNNKTETIRFGHLEFVEEIRFGHLEFVEEVSGAYGNLPGTTFVISLTFVINVKTYGPFGNPYHKKVDSKTNFRFMADEGSSIVGFHGRSGNHLSSIGVYMYPSNRTTVRALHMPVILDGKRLSTPTKSGPWGGSGGSECDIDEKPLHLTSVTVIYERVVNAFSFSYIGQAGKKQSVGPWGEGNHEDKIKTIRFGPSEFLKEVSGAFGKYKTCPSVMKFLTFITNVRTYGPFGTHDHSGPGVPATPFRFMADEGTSIVGFYGGAGKHIDAIGVYTC